MKQHKKIHFIGIGGSGMSALAYLASVGGPTTGSDRFWPDQSDLAVFHKLQIKGVELFPQNGEGITPETDRVVYSTAIEENNPDWLKAKSLGIESIHRAEFLSELVTQKKLIAVGGTSGKTTITGMIGVLLNEMGLSPTVVSGGEIKNFISTHSLGNAFKGDSDTFVIESDESDGSLNLFFPEISILANISKDHKPLEELKRLFTQFAEQTNQLLILNADSPQLSALKFKNRKQFSYGLKNKADIEAKDIQLSLEGSKFKVQGVPFSLSVPGLHNVSNALAAIATGLSLGLSLDKMPPALDAFQGIKRRLDLVSNKNGFTVFDDFAHNPDKIEASLGTLTPHCKRLIVIFQPHGYTPTRFLFDEFVEVFSRELRNQDRLYLLPIFDAGGTTNRSITSNDLAKEIQKTGKFAETPSSRTDLIEKLKNELQDNDTVIVMGARDPSLTLFCQEIASLKVNPTS